MRPTPFDFARQISSRTRHRCDTSSVPDQRPRGPLGLGVNRWIEAKDSRFAPREIEFLSRRSRTSKLRSSSRLDRSLSPSSEKSPRSRIDRIARDSRVCHRGARSFASQRRRPQNIDVDPGEFDLIAALQRPSTDGTVRRRSNRATQHVLRQGGDHLVQLSQKNTSRCASGFCGTIG